MGTGRRTARPEPAARSPAAAALLAGLCDGVDGGLEGVRGGTPGVATAVDEERGRSVDAQRGALLHARLDPAGVALRVHACVALGEVEARSLDDVAEQAPRGLSGQRPLVVEEELGVH